MFTIARNKDDELLLKFLYGTGARISEALNMKM
jgi:site-specific recombinase XerD